MLFTMSTIVGWYMLVSSFPISVEILVLYLKLQKLDYCASEILALPDPLISPNSLVFFSSENLVVNVILSSRLLWSLLYYHGNVTA
jgi:hypothetical protein